MLIALSVKTIVNAVMGLLVLIGLGLWARRLSARKAAQEEGLDAYDQQPPQNLIEGTTQDDSAADAELDSSRTSFEVELPSSEQTDAVNVEHEVDLSFAEQAAHEQAAQKQAEETGDRLGPNEEDESDEIVVVGDSDEPFSSDLSDGEPEASTSSIPLASEAQEASVVPPASDSAAEELSESVLEGIDSATPDTQFDASEAFATEFPDPFAEESSFADDNSKGDKPTAVESTDGDSPSQPAAGSIPGKSTPAKSFPDLSTPARSIPTRTIPGRGTARAATAPASGSSDMGFSSSTASIASDDSALAGFAGASSAMPSKGRPIPPRRSKIKAAEPEVPVTTPIQREASPLTPNPVEAAELPKAQTSEPSVSAPDVSAPDASKPDVLDFSNAFASNANQLHQQQDELSELRLTLEASQTELSRLGAARDQALSIAGAHEHELNRLREQVATAESDQARLLQERAALGEINGRLESDASELKQRLELANENLAKLQSQAELTSSQQSENAQVVAELETKHAATVQELRALLGQHEAAEASLQRERSDLVNQVDEFQARTVDLEATVESLRHQVEQAAEKEAQQAAERAVEQAAPVDPGLSEQLAKTQAEFQQQQADLSLANEAVNQLNQNLSVRDARLYELQREGQEQQTQIEQLQSASEAHEQALAELNTERDRLSEQFTSAQQELSASAETISQLQQQKQQTAAQANDAAQLSTELEAEQARLAAATEEIKKLQAVASDREKQVEELNLEIAALNASVAGIQQQQSDNSQDERLDRLESDKARYAAELEETSTKLTVVSDELEEARVQSAARDNELSELKERYAEVVAELEAKEQRLKAAPDPASVQQISSQFEQTRNELAAIVGQLGEEQQRSLSLQQSVSEAVEAKEQIAAEQAAIEEARNAMTAELADVQAKLSQVTEELAAVKSEAALAAESRAATQSEEMASIQSARASLESELAEVQAKLSHVTEELTAARSEAALAAESRAVAQSDELAAIQSARASLEAELTAVRADLTEADKELAAVRAEAIADKDSSKAARDELASVELARAALEAELADARAKLTATTEELASSEAKASASDELASVESARKELEAELANVKSKLADTTGRLAEVTEQLSEANAQIATSNESSSDSDSAAVGNDSTDESTAALSTRLAELEAVVEQHEQNVAVAQAEKQDLLDRLGASMEDVDAKSAEMKRMQNQLQLAEQQAAQATEQKEAFETAVSDSQSLQSQLKDQSDELQRTQREQIELKQQLAMFTDSSEAWAAERIRLLGQLGLDENGQPLEADSDESGHGQQSGQSGVADEESLAQIARLQAALSERGDAFVDLQRRFTELQELTRTDGSSVLDGDVSDEADILRAERDQAAAAAAESSVSIAELMTKVHELQAAAEAQSALSDQSQQLIAENKEYRKSVAEMHAIANELEEIKIARERDQDSARQRLQEATAANGELSAELEELRKKLAAKQDSNEPQTGKGAAAKPEVAAKPDGNAKAEIERLQSLVESNEAKLESRDERLHELATQISKLRSESKSLRDQLKEQQAIARAQKVLSEETNGVIKDAGTSKLTAKKAVPKQLKQSASEATKVAKSATKSAKKKSVSAKSTATSGSKAAGEAGRTAKPIKSKSKQTSTRIDENLGKVFTKKPADVDDLKKISGVGPVLEKRLNSVGIYAFKQVAKWAAKTVRFLDEELELQGRIKRDDWIGQAKKLAKKK